MSQRGVVFEDDGDGYAQVVDIVEWPEDRLDLNLRRLRRHVRKKMYGDFTIILVQIDGPQPGDIWRGEISVR